MKPYNQNEVVTFTGATAVLPVSQKLAVRPWKKEGCQVFNNIQTERNNSVMINHSR